MSYNTCPCCCGHGNYLDIPQKTSSLLCTGCEIEMYGELHEIMDKLGYNKEQAYEHLKKM